MTQSVCMALTAIVHPLQCLQGWARVGQAHPKILKDDILLIFDCIKKAWLQWVKPHCCYCNHVVTDSLVVLSY